MEFEEIGALRRRIVVWRVLRADHAARALSFHGRMFVDEERHLNG
ncbi:hypothetical protein ACIBI7_51005 [Nonomuraea fuscirosea]